MTDRSSVTVTWAAELVVMPGTVPRPSELARDVSALANASGTWLIIGADESADKGGIGLRGVDVNAAELTLRRALMLLRPTPEVRVEFAVRRTHASVRCR